MKSLRIPALITMLTLIGACAGQDRPPAATTAPAAAPATVAAPEAVAATEAPAVAEDRMICKRIAPTGSRIAKKTCMKASQWEQAQRDAREATDTIQRNSRQKYAPGS